MLLGVGGPFERELDGFQPREVQQEMASVVATTLQRQEVLVCEAGTGTGKTFAYLVPVLTSGLKTIISTATKTLQDQLFHRDLPIVCRALGTDCDIALLKGRQNYVCLYRLERAAVSAEVEQRRLPLLAAMQRWAESSDSGDLEEVRLLDDDPALRGVVTSTTDNCLGQDCPRYDECFVVKARRAAAAADVVVVNHHLLFADLMLRETGFAELLPNADAIILDEAHKVPEIASTFFSHSLSAQQLVSLNRDIRVGADDEAPDMPALKAALANLDLAVAMLRQVLGSQARRVDWASLRDSRAVADATQDFGRALLELDETLELAAARGNLLANCSERLAALRLRWEGFSATADEERVRWVDVSQRNFTFYDTPVSVASEFAGHLASSQAAWIMTSATLAVEGRFDHFLSALGISAARQELWASPFDYARQSLLYIPPLKREPRETDFERELVDAALPVLRASRGRAFFLFTSYRSLDLCAAMLREELDYPLLIQGEAPRSELLRRFQTTDTGVLLGTATFWEGVDVRGERLSLVIIDKLPFGVPDDPVARARSAAIAAAGDNPFKRLTLPDAITTLKQGAGRLIRDVADHGVLMIGDVRLKRKSYGRAFLNSLPPMPVTQQLEDVEAFFHGR
ncbi:MAG: ATP-dependent DNA helicase [Gammaproteobacteria bacterium]|nr:ATP-dependent DNA helicase [Gammaproteobacteria bacterium]